MKINSTYLPNPAALGNRVTGVASQHTAQTSDSVSLSSAATALQSDVSSTVDLTRIQEIKDAISQGRFKINPGAIAEGLIESAKDIINSQRQA